MFGERFFHKATFVAAHVLVHEFLWLAARALGGGASSRGSGGKAACDGGSGSAMTSEAACGTTPGRGC